MDLSYGAFCFDIYNIEFFFRMSATKSDHLCMYAER